MKGIIESTYNNNQETKYVDLFCGNCGDLIKIKYLIKKNISIECPVCEEMNDFSPKDNVRTLPESFKKWNRRYPIRYWANKYGIPENSCYMAFRKRRLGKPFKHSIGSARKMTQREFLSAVVYTEKGRKLISDLIKNESLLTDKTIHDSLP